MEKVEWSNREAKQIADKCCEKNDFILMDIRKLPHEGDYYLRYVLAYSEKKQEYATWLLNLSQGGLSYGHYYSHYFNDSKMEAYVKAVEDFKNRD